MGIRWEGHLRGHREESIKCVYVCSVNVCVFICLDSDLTSSLDGPFHSVHSRHTMTADEEVVLIITTWCCSLVLGLWLGVDAFNVK